MSRCKLLSPTIFLVVCCLGLNSCTTKSVQDVIQAAGDTAKESIALSATYEGSPVTIYSQIAQGANACWFAPKSKLRKNHMFHAITATDRKKAQAAIHEIEKDGKRGLKVFSVNFWEAGKGTKIAFQNIRFRDNIAKLMESDVKRWATGDPSCSKPLVPPFAAETGVSISQFQGKPVIRPVKAEAAPKP